jgi:hypothetical protein
MKRMFGLFTVGLAVSIWVGCGEETSVSSVLEQDYGIRTLKNGSAFEGTLVSRDQFVTFLLEVPTVNIEITVTGSKDIEFEIAQKGASGWEVIQSIDDNGDNPDLEVFTGNLAKGTYTVTLHPYKDPLSYTISVNW